MITDLTNIIKSSVPFNHYIIDNFFDEEVARKLSQEFLPFDSDVWYQYNNKIEKKRAMADWGKFPKQTYSVISYLCSPEFIDIVKDITGITSLYADPGLHGGGWHMSSRGGKLNIHKDYSIHPRVDPPRQRKLNLIVYLTENWNPEWGGALEFWSHDEKKNKPLKKMVEVPCLFNKAVLFDTTQNSWHGLPDEIQCPEDVHRKSIAVYYLTDINNTAEDRQRALFAPYKEQENDPELLNFIKKRCQV